MIKPKIFVGKGLMRKMPLLLNANLPAYKYAIITDSVTKKLYGDSLLVALRKAGLKAELFSFPAGEKSKNLDTWKMLSYKMLEKGFGRDSAVLALGGGVTGDLAGFVASTYLRGIPFAQIPTTVLAVIDSAIGGKTGLDTPYGKNMIGSFWQPKIIVADFDTLKTLPKMQIENGWFELLKIFLTMDKKLYEKAKSSVKFGLLKDAMRLKLKVTSLDERENGLRSILNFGHTVGHALELLSKYKLPHGFGVGLGVILEARISVEIGKLTEEEWTDIVKTMGRFSADISALKPYKVESVWEAMQSDKKNANGQVRFVLLNGIGEVLKKRGGILHGVNKELFMKVWKNTLSAKI